MENLLRVIEDQKIDMNLPSLTKNTRTLFTLVIVISIPALWLWYNLAGPGYFAEFHDIMARFEEMPNVQIIYIGGTHDITYEEISAIISIEDKGEMELYALTRNSFENPAHISLSSICGYEILVEGEGYLGVTNASGEPVRSKFYGGSIDIGSEGVFADVFPFQIKNVQDAIAKYDDICTVITEWAVDPAENHIQDKNGTNYYYSAKKEPYNMRLTQIRSPQPSARNRITENSWARSRLSGLPPQRSRPPQQRL